MVNENSSSDISRVTSDVPSNVLVRLLGLLTLFAGIYFWSFSLLKELVANRSLYPVEDLTWILFFVFFGFNWPIFLILVKIFGGIYHASQASIISSRQKIAEHISKANSIYKSILRSWPFLFIVPFLIVVVRFMEWFPTTMGLVVLTIISIGIGVGYYYLIIFKLDSMESLAKHLLTIIVFVLYFIVVVQITSNVAVEFDREFYTVDDTIMVKLNPYGFSVPRIINVTYWNERLIYKLSNTEQYPGAPRYLYIQPSNLTNVSHNSHITITYGLFSEDWLFGLGRKIISHKVVFVPVFSAKSDLTVEHNIVLKSADFYDFSVVTEKKIANSDGDMSIEKSNLLYDGMVAWGTVIYAVLTILIFLVMFYQLDKLKESTHLQRNPIVLLDINHNPEGITPVLMGADRPFLLNVKNSSQNLAKGVSIEIHVKVLKDSESQDLLDVYSIDYLNPWEHAVIPFGMKLTDYLKSKKLFKELSGCQITNKYGEEEFLKKPPKGEKPNAFWLKSMKNFSVELSLICHFRDEADTLTTDLKDQYIVEYNMGDLLTEWQPTMNVRIHHKRDGWQIFHIDGD